MSERKSLSKKLRFQVFKRDLFSCQYCGRNPPTVVLEVDHIIPVSKNGDNSIENLITSCFDCNRGKGADELSNIPKREIDTEKLELLREKEMQYKEYQKLLLSVDKRLNAEIELVNNKFTSFYPEKEFTEKFKSSVKYFINTLGLKNVLDAMDRAAIRIVDGSSSDFLNYFCGICWNMIKNNRKSIDDKGDNYA